MLSTNIRSTSETSRRWYCRCQGVQWVWMPATAEESTLDHPANRNLPHLSAQSRLRIFVHSEAETRLVFDENTAPCHILDQT